MELCENNEAGLPPLPGAVIQNKHRLRVKKTSEKWKAAALH